MSLEEAIRDLTAAVNKNSDLLKPLVARVKETVATSGEDTGAGKATSDDGSGRRGRGRPAGSTNKPKVPTVAEMKEAAQKFLDVADEAVFADRKSALVEIVHSFGVKKFTEIAEDDRPSALDQLKDAEKGGEGDDLV